MPGVAPPITVHVVGMDAGFHKTGLCAIALTDGQARLVEAVTIIPEIKKTNDLKSITDIEHIREMRRLISAYFKRWSPWAVFAELPTGAAMSARATRCMSLITATVITMMEYEGIPFEYYTPTHLEQVLGIALTTDQKKTKKWNKMKSGEKTAFKKERIAQVVNLAWPDFIGWPEKKELREDAVDSAAAFLCAKSENRLYQKIQENAVAWNQKS